MDEIRGMKGEIRGIKEEIHDMNQKIEDNHQENQAGNERVISAVNTLTDIVQAWMVKTKKVDEHENRIRRLERHTGLE